MSVRIGCSVYVSVWCVCVCLCVCECVCECACVCTCVCESDEFSVVRISRERDNYSVYIVCVS